MLKEVIEYTSPATTNRRRSPNANGCGRSWLEPDPRAKLAMHARGVTAIMKRSYRLDWVLRTAAPVDADADALWRKRRASTPDRDGTTGRPFARMRGPAPGLTVTEATDRVATLIDPELYRLTVGELQWTPEQYEGWLTELLIASLLATPSTRS